MQVELRGAKGSAELLEDFDVEDAIKVVRELGEDLIRATASAKHHFRTEWVDQLVSRYRENPGKPLVHLSDLRDTVMPVLTNKARALVLGCLASHSQKMSFGGWSHPFRNIAAFAGADRSKPAKLRTWKQFAKLTGFDMNLLEPYVSALKLSGGRGMRTVISPNLPMNLASPAGAKLIGY
ncbi:MAG TPA: hypothetical protein VK126_01860, partial [Nitrososphaerales archaeon]|nr:hypothetical protein [Nitrososphaerales archaeon]